MSHELRTPLNAILGFSQLMMRETDLLVEYRENLGVINRSGEHLLGLINDVLKMSKIEAGRPTLTKENFDLHQMLRGVEEMFQLRAEDKGLRLIFDWGPDVPRYIHTDESKLRQVLINLVGNAIKFTQEGRVTLRARHRFNIGNRLYFEIEDTGAGISDTEMDTLFEAFTQTASGRESKEGTGLGLPISQMFVRLMEGDLTVSSKAEEGSMFSFDIGIEIASGSDVDTEETRFNAIGLEPDQPDYRILIVEDRMENRRLLSQLLTKIGFEVREASNGKEGVEICEEWLPHLIWMDMRMPVMDGYEATKRIKASRNGKDTIVIALTASAFEEDRTAVLSAGCDDFMRKPFQVPRLLEAMVQHLGVRFIYEDGIPTHSESVEVDETEALTIEAMPALPDEWLARLCQAANRADNNLIYDLLLEIEEDHVFVSSKLAELTEQFRLEKIIELSERG